MFKKLRKNDYNWTANYIKEYNDMIAHYEKQLEEKDKIIAQLTEENLKLRKSKVFGKKKQITDEEIYNIRKLKIEGKSYSYISRETGWSKATISRVVNNEDY